MNILLSSSYLLAGDAASSQCALSIINDWGPFYWHGLTLIPARIHEPTLDLALYHCSDVIMGAMASQISRLTIVYSTVNPGADQRKHQISASPAFVWGIHRWPVNSPQKGPVTRKLFPFDDVIMILFSADWALLTHIHLGTWITLYSYRWS